MGERQVSEMAAQPPHFAAPMRAWRTLPLFRYQFNKGQKAALKQCFIKEAHPLFDVKDKSRADQEEVLRATLQPHNRNLFSPYSQEEKENKHIWQLSDCHKQWSKDNTTGTMTIPWRCRGGIVRAMHHGTKGNSLAHSTHEFGGSIATFKWQVEKKNRARFGGFRGCWSTRCLVQLLELPVDRQSASQRLQERFAMSSTLRTLRQRELDTTARISPSGPACPHISTSRRWLGPQLHKDDSTNVDIREAVLHYSPRKDDPDSHVEQSIATWKWARQRGGTAMAILSSWTIAMTDADAREGGTPLLNVWPLCRKDKRGKVLGSGGAGAVIKSCKSVNKKIEDVLYRYELYRCCAVCCLEPDSEKNPAMMTKLERHFRKLHKGLSISGAPAASLKVVSNTVKILGG
ncbi:hypothetical protein BDK51DRAFT_26179 [Blyttiomyces helicus]|uniref:Uncharacterized protein n=1 Tax=Blyttiomyces helicus TaxID=388810 RepID=A0A4P9WJL5_9FUNG|nr:hypothetical protein BDK51DRAFT_26179 [Blyttiomyces helicus]|eukprot:RKO92562.1 hypothetical protein BDK51DRAFT_26179 [Blyttiomyces helicus]